MGWLARATSDVAGHHANGRANKLAGKTLEVNRYPDGGNMKAFQDIVAGGGAGLRLLSARVLALEGGVPVIIDGKVVGAIGVSGVTSEQDAQVAMSGAAAAK